MPRPPEAAAPHGASRIPPFLWSIGANYRLALVGTRYSGSCVCCGDLASTWPGPWCSVTKMGYA